LTDVNVMRMRCRATSSGSSAVFLANAAASVADSCAVVAVVLVAVVAMVSCFGYAVWCGVVGAVIDDAN
jgi:hypothetical protein